MSGRPSSINIRAHPCGVAASGGCNRPAQYGQLIRAMKRAEAKMAPVLAAFHDQVLFFKHNLNAQAIASLKGNLASIESDIAVLIREMEASIREANRFIDAMNVEQVS